VFAIRTWACAVTFEWSNPFTTGHDIDQIKARPKLTLQVFIINGERTRPRVPDAATRRANEHAELPE